MSHRARGGLPADREVVGAIPPLAPSVVETVRRVQALMDELVQSDAPAEDIADGLVQIAEDALMRVTYRS